MFSRPTNVLLAAFIFVIGAGAASAQTARSGEPLQIKRLSGPVTIDGDISDAAWQQAARVDRWYETNPGDNVAPKVRSVGYLGYDDKFFYAAFEFDDPSPSQIRAPVTDR